MDKYYEKWNGVEYPVRVVPIPEEWGFGSPAIVADIELWSAIEYACNHEESEQHSDAIDLDNEIFFYCDSGLVASDPSDEYLVEYLRKRIV